MVESKEDAPAAADKVAAGETRLEARIPGYEGACFIFNVCKD